ncbi:hypothetical protein BK010_06655 [Tenericutes bacterium MO-XQ]|nr:hypothetical protein BK010_06655 [Tenericutes bacterium MO-XQ]
MIKAKEILYMNQILEQLKIRFNENKERHPELHWEDVEKKLNQKYLNIISEMEKYDGEPDVIMFHDELYYVDFSKETPKPRTSVCYDEEARLSRKKFPPETSAEAFAKKIGITLMNENMYRYMQSLEPIDLKTSSWIKTPDDIRSLGGALFGDHRYKTTFIYHNGADSYYGSRGFRGYLKIT